MEKNICNFSNGQKIIKTHLCVLLAAAEMPHPSQKEEEESIIQEIQLGIHLYCQLLLQKHIIFFSTSFAKEIFKQ